MSKSKVSEWDVVSDNNIVINGININENCPPSAVNNAIREMMAQIKQWQSGASGDDWTSTGVFNITGELKLDGSPGANEQVLSSKGPSATPIWRTLGTMSNQNSSSVTTGDLNVTGSLKLDGSVGGNGQVLKSLGSTATPIWTSLGSMSSQNSNAVNITGGSVKTTGDLNVTGALKLDNSVGGSGQVLSSKGSTATPVWKTLANMSNQSSNAVNITGGTITGLSNLTATNATFTNTNTTGSVKYDGHTGSPGHVLTSQGGATPIWKAVSAPDSYTKAEINAQQQAQDVKINANTAKAGNATHTGDVTGSGYLTIGTGKVTNHKLATNAVTAVKIASNAVDNTKVSANAIKANELYVSGNGNTSQYLRADGDGTFTWATPTDTKTSTTYQGVGTYSCTSTLDSTPLKVGETITMGSQRWRVMGITGHSSANIYQGRTHYLIVRIS